MALNTFLNENRQLDDGYFLHAYESDSVRYRSFEEAKSAGATFATDTIAAKTLDDLRKAVHSGKLDANTFTGGLHLYRRQLFNDKVIDLTFVDGKLERKGIGEQFF